MLFRLKVFLAVAEYLNFTRASKELYISQPAITRHIQELEKEFQVRLLVRSGSRVSLTREGEIFRDRVIPIMEDYKKLESEMMLLRGSVGGELRLGASTTIAQYLIAPILAGFRERFPQVEIRLVTGNSEFVEDAVEGGKADLGLVEGSHRRPHLKYSFLAKDELVLVTSSKTECDNTVQVADLPRLPLVLREPGSGTLEVLEMALSVHGMKLSDLDVLLHIGATEGIKGYLKASPGSYGVMSMISVRDALMADELKIIDIEDLALERDFSFVAEQGASDPLRERFIEFAVHCVSNNFLL